MIDDATLAERGAQTVRANGIDIAYVEAGDGPAARPAPRRPRLDRTALGRQPRRLRRPHGPWPSTSGSSPPTPEAAAPPPTGGAHRSPCSPTTSSPSSTHSGLDRPLLAGFSEGALTATIIAIREPDSVRAIVNARRLRSPRPRLAHVHQGTRSSAATPKPPRPTPTPPPRTSRRCRHGRDVREGQSRLRQRPG